MADENETAVLETEQPTTAIATTEERMDLVNAGFDPDLDFRKLVKEATYVAAGFRLVSKADLVGVPHVIVGLTYREGMPRNGRVGDYVSVEAVVADAEIMEAFGHSGFFGAEPPKVFPNEAVVYNDSGTGVRRALTAYLHQIGHINVGDPMSREEAMKLIPQGGSMNAVEEILAKNNRYDRSYPFWASGADTAAKGITTIPDGRRLAFVCPRGLRASTYEFAGGEATTYYLG